MINREESRVETGIRNLDVLFGGGLPRGSVIVLSGPPGSGKTTLAQQICFHNASPTNRILYFGTLSEPTAKTLRYLRHFDFFDDTKLEEGIQFVDLGIILRGKGLEHASALIMEHIKKVKPGMVVIDSFKAFGDLAESTADLRKFGYEVTVNLMAWETTAILCGEYSASDYDTNPMFSIVDGLCALTQRVEFNEAQRFFHIVKLRGTDHSRDEHPFAITSRGIELFTPRTSIQRIKPVTDPDARCLTHIPRLDELFGPGIPLGSSLLVSGVAGTGKTVLSLEFLYRGALAGEKGILFSFEETEDRLRATARGLGWDLDREIARGMVEILFTPQPEIRVDANTAMMRDRIAAMGAQRVVVDSVSVFLNKVTDAQVSRDKLFHLCTIIQNARAVGFLSTDIPYGSSHISRFGVEETVVDGVVLLTSSEEGLERERYIEVYKLRNTAHLKGRHNMAIGQDGIAVFPRYGRQRAFEVPPPPPLGSRMGTGVPGLDDLLGGGVLERSATLVSGSAGIGKSTLGLQFVLEGARLGEPGLFITLEEAPAQLVAGADALGLPIRAAIESGLVEISYLPREKIRAGQLLTVLADKLEAFKARRLVLDAAMHMTTSGMAYEEFRHLLYNLVGRFKSLGVTSLITIESPSLTALDSAIEAGLSPISDNLIFLRYHQGAHQLAPMLVVVKTRGTAHDRGTYRFTVGQGGLRVGPSTGDPESPA